MSGQTTPPTQKKPDGDLLDILSFARKLANADSIETVSDRDFLLALLLSNRMFSPLDAFLKNAGAKPKQVLKVFQDTLKEQPQPATPVCTVLPVGSALAGIYPQYGKKITVTHALLALTESEDPAIRQTFARFSLTREKMLAAIDKSKSQDTFRIACYLTRELGEVVIFVLFFLVIIKSFLGELRLIPSESMVPTLAVEDRIVIERVTPWFRPYQQKDILVFYPPMTELKNDPWSLFLRLTGFSGLIYKKEDNIDIAYIKRLIGKPGDIVQVRPNEGVVVNGKMLDEPYTREKAMSCTLEPRFVAVPLDKNDTRRTLLLGDSGIPMTDLEIWQFNLENGMLRNPVHIPKTQLQQLLKTQSLDYADHVCLPVEVPKGHYFLMGDNRNESLDSRYWGFEEQDRVIGRAVYRLWPLNRMSTLDIAAKRLP